MKYYLVVSGALLIAGCAQQGRDAPEPPHEGMNPVYLYCEQKGGTKVPVQTPQGVHSACKLPSGEVVDEWTLWSRDHPSMAK